MSEQYDQGDLNCGPDEPKKETSFLGAIFWIIIFVIAYYFLSPLF